MGPRTLLHALRRYGLRAKIVLADFNLAVSILTTKLPNLISRHIFQLYRESTDLATLGCDWRLSAWFQESQILQLLGLIGQLCMVWYIYEALSLGS